MMTRALLLGILWPGAGVWLQRRPGLGVLVTASPTAAATAWLGDDEANASVRAQAQ